MRLPFIVSAAVAAGGLLGLLPAARGAGKLKVVTTTSDLRSVVEAIGGDKVEAASMGTGREDPHFIDAKPSCMVLARDADLWVCIGMELEIGYENLVIDGSRNTKIRIGTPGHLDASEGVLRLEVPTGKIDRSMGDIHPMGNPHYWLDPLNMRIVAKNVAGRLSKLDAADGDYFAERLKTFTARLDEAMFGPKLLAATGAAAGSAEQGGAKAWALLLKGELETFVKDHGGDELVGGWWGAMRPLAGSKILTYHRSWTYFANRFGLQVVAELEPKPGIEPSPSHLNEVLQIVEHQNVKFLLMEPFYSRQAPDWLAKKTGLHVVQVANSVGGQPEATDYVAMIDNIVRRSVEATAASSASPPKE
jgi:zinc/manganese transport system substrate-binding protein